MPAHPVRRILIAPLDWGLGHTTRCVPVIRRLLHEKREVIVAGNDVQKTFLSAAFPGIRCLDLPGYGVKYSAGRFLPNILRQIPKILRSIRREHTWLLKTAEQERFDAIISDNRYGLWHPELPCAILTHQAGILSGLGRTADAMLRRMHYPMLERFSETWLADVAGSRNLSGKLSHPSQLPANARYIGWLSQLQPPGNLNPEGYVLILLSGPEPQRTMLADILWEQVCALPDRRFLFVEGREDAQRASVPPHIRHYPRATTKQMQGILAGASMVVCRSGYSSLMDLVLFGMPAILIPTPGQTEQEYLARKLEADGHYMQCAQDGFRLNEALEAAAARSLAPLQSRTAHRQFEAVLDAFISSDSASPGG